MVFIGWVVLILGIWIFWRSISERKNRSMLKTSGVLIASLFVMFMGLGFIGNGDNSLTKQTNEATKAQISKKHTKDRSAKESSKKAKSEKIASSRAKSKSLASEEKNKSEKAAAASKSKSESIATSESIVASSKSESEKVAQSIASSKSISSEKQAAAVSESVAQSQSVAEANRQVSIAASQSQQQATAVEAETPASETPVSTSGYKRDYRGRWHRSNGQYASKVEIAQAGLPW